MKETREALRMPQIEFARHVRCTPSFVAKTELGERRLDVAEFLELSKALGSTPRKMFDRLMLNDLNDDVINYLRICQLHHSELRRCLRFSISSRSMFSLYRR